MNNTIAELAGKISERITTIRHDIHQHPEIGRKEFRTAGVIASFLDEIGVSHTRCTETGVVALIGSGEGRVIALRGDMDALSMPDSSGLMYASVNEGLAHACGHDGHVAVLLGTAWVLKQLERDLPGTVKLIFQPDEEGGTGARSMIEAGALENPAPEVIYAIHGWPDFSPGKVGYRFGPVLASVNSFRIIARGRGTHGALPHAGVDPVAMAARIIDGVQHIRSRMISPLEPVVISICTIEGGTAVNVIPDEVVMKGTIRTLNPNTQKAVLDMMERMVAGTARASGGEGIFDVTASFPPTINDTRATAFARDVIADLIGAENAVEVEQSSMGGEDFSAFLQEVPGSFLMLGVGDRIAIHNPSFDFNDEVIPVGIQVMAGISVRFLEKGLD